jgi:hypothetical protein
MIPAGNDIIIPNIACIFISLETKEKT